METLKEAYNIQAKIAGNIAAYSAVIFGCVIWIYSIPRLDDIVVQNTDDGEVLDRAFRYSGVLTVVASGFAIVSHFLAVIVGGLSDKEE